MPLIIPWLYIASKEYNFTTRDINLEVNLMMRKGVKVDHEFVMMALFDNYSIISYN